MASDIFVDTSGFFALLVKDDSSHMQAAEILQNAKGAHRFVTTDYVLDETATLMKARRHGSMIKPFLDAVLNSKVCRIVWMEPDLFSLAYTFFLKHADQEYSFTDCVSFLTMRNQRIKTALTKDSHFRRAGFEVLLSE